jgi:hypothetical protein
VAVTPAGQLEIVNVFQNPDFGRNNISFSQEGIDNRRSVRIRLRLSF